MGVVQAKCIINAAHSAPAVMPAWLLYFFGTPATPAEDIEATSPTNVDDAYAHFAVWPQTHVSA